MDYSGQRSQHFPPGSRSEGDSSSAPGGDGLHGFGGKSISEVGVWCERCNNRLVELKKQALRLMIMHPSLMKLAMKDSSALLDRLEIPANMQEAWTNNQCQVCSTHLLHLKHEAVEMVQSLEDAHCSSGSSGLGKLSGVIGSSNLASLQRYLYANHAHAANPPGPQRQMKPGKGRLPPKLPTAVQAQQYLEESIGPAWWNHPKFSAFFQQQQHQQGGFNPAPAQPNKGPYMDIGLSRVPPVQPATLGDRFGLPASGLSPASMGLGVRPSSTSQTSAASFFARAAQKLNLSSKKKRKQEEPLPPPPAPEPPPFPTNFSDIIRQSPPPPPPSLLKNVGRVKENPGVGKVKVMLKLVPSSNPNDSASFVTVDTKKKQVTLFDPSALSGFVTPAGRRAGVAAPKMFAFDNIFPQDASQMEICSNSVADIVQAVVNGADGCLFGYGHSHLGKTYTMIGGDESHQTLGAIPCAIAWLFKLINEKKERTSTRFSVRVSAVEVHGKQEHLRDLLLEQANGSNNGGGASPAALYLQEDPICGVQLLNQSELRAPTAEKAAFYLDAAIAARMNHGQKEEPEAGKYSHMLFTLHVYQYRIDKFGKGGVNGGRSRLHLIDLGSGDKSSGKVANGSSLTFSALGNVILAVLNGQKHIPYRDSKLTRLLREAMGSLSCRTVMIAHASSAVPFYSETLSTIQLASRIHRMRKKKSKYSGTSSSGGESSCEEGRMRRIRPAYRRTCPSPVPEGVHVTNALNQSDPEYLSSSEQSCDTVIYVGPDGCPLSDRELTDNEGPPDVLPALMNLNLSDSQSSDDNKHIGSGSDGENQALFDGEGMEEDDIRTDLVVGQNESSDTEVGNNLNTATENSSVRNGDEDIAGTCEMNVNGKTDGQTSSENERENNTLSNDAQCEDENKNRKDQTNQESEPGKLCKPEVPIKPSKLKYPPLIKEKPQLPSKPLFPEEIPKEQPVFQKSALLHSEKVKASKEKKAPCIPEEPVDLGDTEEIEMPVNFGSNEDIEKVKQLVDCDEMENIQEMERERLSDPEKRASSNYDDLSISEFGDEDELTAALRTADADFTSQVASVSMEEPVTPTNGKPNLLDSIPLTPEERQFLSSTSLFANPECLMKSFTSLDRISELLEKPVSELSEDEISLAFSEQETLSFISRASDELTTVTDTLTIDEMPLGSEAVCWFQQLAQRSMDNFSENISTSLNNPSVGGCLDEPYLLLGMEERKKMTVGHYVYSDDESEVVEAETSKRETNLPDCFRLDNETLDSMSLASNDLEAIKSMYVISNMQADNLSVDSDPMDDADLPPGLDLGDNLLTHEPAVMTYMTINNDDQVVMREKHMADDHPLRRLSCISDATDATFSTTSRPSSFISEKDDDNSPSQTSSLGRSVHSKSPQDSKMNDRIAAALHLQKLQAQILARAIAANYSPRMKGHPANSPHHTKAACNQAQVSGNVSPVWQKMATTEESKADPIYECTPTNSVSVSVGESTPTHSVSLCESTPTHTNSVCDSTPSHSSANTVILADRSPKKPENKPISSTPRISPFKKKNGHKPLLGVSAALSRNLESSASQDEDELIEMWKDRKPDGACSEDMCDLVRPPVIGACSSPTFHVEVNPCYSQEFEYESKERMNYHVLSPKRGLETVPEVENHIYASLERETPEKLKSEAKTPKSEPVGKVSKSSMSKLPLPSSSKTPSKLPPRKQYRSSGSKSDSETRKSSSKLPRTSKIPQGSGKSSSKPSSSVSSKLNEKPSSIQRTNSLPTHNKSISKSTPALSKSGSSSSKVSSRDRQGSQLPVRMANGNLGTGKRLTNVSDSSNDSGIASGENGHHRPAILSPYSKVTEPRVKRGASSGHGSDNSSSFSDHPPRVTRRLQGASGMSSGYESNRRDSYSEATASAPDSFSEGSYGKVRGSKMVKKKFPAGTKSNSKRNRGIPRSSASDTGVPVSHRPGRPRPLKPEEGMEIKVYEVDDPNMVKQQRAEPVKQGVCSKWEDMNQKPECMFWKKWTPSTPSNLKPWKKRQAAWKSD
ncbi:Kinesin-like protein KIF26B [Holothuria leucospilota]|uniref:Kinesin-like protein KIF26B n=1 Tax=Holothuria leucospilota TaxID=206669 RepID=A0A9Q1CHA9_HOLLE|nr:Kinesin-like protein KIF26B [Holothuria leucospilota]